MSEEQEVFVSRHGRRTKLDNVDLSGVNIEDEPTRKPAPPSEITSPKVRLRPEIHLPRPHMSRRQIAFTALGIVVAILLPLVALELIALQYRANGEALRKDVANIGTTIALPAQKSSAQDGLDKTLSALASKRDGACRGGVLDNIAFLYPRAKDALAQCNAARADVSQLTTHLSHLKDIQAYSNSVSEILKPALAASESPYAVLPDQVATWQAATGKLKVVNAPGELKSLHDSLKQLVGNIETQWSALNSANNAQDQAAFSAAEAKLGSFYESMRELSPTLTEITLKVQSDVTMAVGNTR